ncbi:MAG: hypothetical protein Q9M36_02110 [Sulfurovum sp.]|nr:hypothetical protein [Sulfurovum sp.]
MSIYTILENVKYRDVKDFNIKQNGIQVIHSDLKIEIYNDPFRTIPLFIAKDRNDGLIIFSNFEDFYTIESIDKTIDKVGFWEIVLFGSGLWTRTLYENVEQMPSASKITIDKKTNTYTIQRYWDFNIEVDKSIDSREKAAQGLYDRLDSIFSKFDKTQKYVMGMSGGMDSRITLAFLSKYIPKENVKLFTFGFDERLLEYTYACDVASALGYDTPIFHKLTKDSYIKAMGYLPQMSGGQIAINHCHILDFLDDNALKGYTKISNYFSDALFGYDCLFPKKDESISDNYYVKYLDNIHYLSSKIKKSIISDSKKIFIHFKRESNYSSLSEYKYLTERNQKFHAYLAYIQKSDLVLASYDLLHYMISVPIQFREQKQLLDIILDKEFTIINSVNIKNISSRDFNGVSSGFTLENKFSAFFEWYTFKFLNRANAVLRPLTKGYIQLFNKYQTEEQERLLYRDFHNELKDANNKFVQHGIMTKEQKKIWDTLPLKSAGVGERYTLIGLGKLI